MDSSMATSLADILHSVSQALLAPDIILLLAFIAYALFSIGSVIVEYVTERRHFQVVMPKFLAALIDASEEEIPQVIEQSGLLNRQKEALNTVYEYRRLPGDALIALVRRLVNEEETHYDRITGRNNTAAKVAPMLGLMGTLIPLGPGIEALGRADAATLSSSLLIAFDTTVAGLVTAAVCLVIGKIRSNWYDNYLSALDAAMATMLEKIEGARSGDVLSGKSADNADTESKNTEASSDEVKEPADYHAEEPKDEPTEDADDQGIPSVGNVVVGIVDKEKKDEKDEPSRSHDDGSMFVVAMPDDKGDSKDADASVDGEGQGKTAQTDKE